MTEEEEDGGERGWGDFGGGRRGVGLREGGADRHPKEVLISALTSCVPRQSLAAWGKCGSGGRLTVRQLIDGAPPLVATMCSFDRLAIQIQTASCHRNCSDSCDQVQMLWKTRANTRPPIYFHRLTPTVLHLRYFQLPSLFARTSCFLNNGIDESYAMLAANSNSRLHQYASSSGGRRNSSDKSIPSLCGVRSRL